MKRMLFFIGLCTLFANFSIGRVNMVQAQSDKIYLSSSEETQQKEIYNDQGITITVEALQVKNGKGNTELSFLVHNSSEQDYRIFVNSYSINGLMSNEDIYDSLSYVDVPTGKNARLSMSLENSWFLDNGIPEIQKIDIVFEFYTDYTLFYSDVISIYTDTYEESDSFVSTGEEIYSDDIVTLRHIDDFTFALFNKSGYNAGYIIENASVNDWSYELTDYTYTLYNKPIQANTYSIFTIPIEREFLIENNLNEIENIEFDILLEEVCWISEGLPWEHKTEKIKIEY